MERDSGILMGKKILIETHVKVGGIDYRLNHLEKTYSIQHHENENIIRMINSSNNSQNLYSFLKEVATVFEGLNPTFVKRKYERN